MDLDDLAEQLIADLSHPVPQPPTARARPRGRPAGTRKVSKDGESYGAPQMLLRLPPELMDWV